MGHNVIPFDRSRAEEQPGSASLAEQLVAACHEVEHLRLALANSRMIGMAMGIVIERQECTPDGAFAVLRRISQCENRKLHEVARDVVASGQLPGDL